MPSVIAIAGVASAVTFDDLGTIGVDPRWENLGKIHEYIEARFPLVYVSSSAARQESVC